MGVSYRYYQGRDMQSFNSGLIALDRRDLSVGETPTGKALRFAYKGSFHQMEDTIYNAIPEYLDEKQVDPSGTFIEEYKTDPVTTSNLVKLIPATATTGPRMKTANPR